jgi:hypothetical protein
MVAKEVVSLVGNRRLSRAQGLAVPLVARKVDWSIPRLLDSIRVDMKTDSRTYNELISRFRQLAGLLSTTASGLELNKRICMVSVVQPVLGMLRSPVALKEVE